MGPFETGSKMNFFSSIMSNDRNSHHSDKDKDYFIRHNLEKEDVSTVTGSIEFGTMKKKAGGNHIRSVQGREGSIYKLIDLGTAVAVHDVDPETEMEGLRTVTELEFAG